MKTGKRRFIHIIGSPGTGKSINIYHAVKELDLNVYETRLLLDNLNESSREVFMEFFKSLKEDLEVKTNIEV